MPKIIRRAIRDILDFVEPRVPLFFYINSLFAMGCAVFTALSTSEGADVMGMIYLITGLLLGACGWVIEAHEKIDAHAKLAARIDPVARWINVCCPGPQTAGTAASLIGMTSDGQGNVNLAGVACRPDLADHLTQNLRHHPEGTAIDEATLSRWLSGDRPPVPDDTHPYQAVFEALDSMSDAEAWRCLHNAITNLAGVDRGIGGARRPPTGDDYNDLHDAILDAVHSRPSTH